MAKDDDFSDIPRERKEPRPDFSKQPLPRKKLPPSIQATLDDDEKLWEALYEGQYVLPVQKTPFNLKDARSHSTNSRPD